MYGHRRLCRLVYFKFTYRLVWLAPARLQCTMANGCNWNMCADIHCICLRFIFNKALSAAPNTLDSDDRALLSVSEFSYAQCLWISSAVLRELTYACWDFICPFVIVLLSLSLFPLSLETCADVTGPHNHPEGSLKCSHSQGRNCLQCGPDP